MVDKEQDIWFTFSFDKEGNVFKYSFNKITNKRWLFTDYGYTRDFKWSVSEDSIINFMGTSEKVLRVSGDTLITKNINLNEYSKFIAVRSSLNIQE